MSINRDRLDELTNNANTYAEFTQGLVELIVEENDCSREEAIAFICNVLQK